MNIAWNPHDKNLNLTQRAEISFRHTGQKPWPAPLRPIYMQFKPNKPTLAFQILYTLQVSCYSVPGQDSSMSADYVQQLMNHPQKISPTFDITISLNISLDYDTILLLLL